jgi:hypothetical protein
MYTFMRVMLHSVRLCSFSLANFDYAMLEGRPLSTISPAHVMTDPRCVPHAFAEGPHPLVYFSPWPVIACEKLPHMLGVLARQVVLFLLLSAHWASATATVLWSDLLYSACLSRHISFSEFLFLL